MGSVIRRLLVLLRLRRFEQDLDDELAFHLAMKRQAREGEGLTPEEAARQARRDVGSSLQLREEARDVWVARWMDQLSQDARYAVRTLRHQPGFAAAVIATLSLGIGANAAIFSVVDALLLRPPPFAHADRLLLIQASRPAQHQAELPLSYPNFIDLRARTRAFDGVAAWMLAEMTITGAGAPDQVQAATATANLFDVLGVTPALGRTFRPEEDRQGTAPVVVISHGYWTNRFARSPAAVGSTIRLDGVPHTIVGVLPEGFRFAGYPHETSIWLPFGRDTFPDRQYARGLSTLLVVGRLRDGIIDADAQREVADIAAALAKEYPDNNRGRLLFAVPLMVKASSRVRLALTALSASVVVVLLIACANVVNLLLGRASARRHELAVRAALGGSRRRIASQLLVEYIVLAAAGGMGGLVVAKAAQQLLVRLPYNTSDYYTPWVAPLDAIALNGRVMLFTLGISLAVGLLIGLLPALLAPAAMRPSMAGGVRIGTPRAAMRVRSILVAGEIAMAVVLLATMALMLTSVARLLRVDPGFAPDGVSAVTLSLPASRYPASPSVLSFYDSLLTRLAATPGMSGVGAVETLPFSGLDPDTGLLYDSAPIPPTERRPRAHFRAVTDGYFAAMGIPLVDGRSFAASDRVASPPVAIVNETAARLWFSDGHPLARRVALDFDAMRYFRDRAPVFDLPLGLREIVGVVKDVRHGALTADPNAELYVPFRQRTVRKMTVVVRSTLAASAVQSAVTAIVRDLDPEQPVPAAAAMTDLIGASTSRPRFDTTLISAFGLLALVLAAVGIYGVMSYLVTIRRRDIVIHVAVGAARRDVFRIVTRPMLRTSAVGLVVGLIGALAAGPAISRLLFDVKPRDPAILAGVVVTIAVTAGAAMLIPALRALKIDARALRD